MSKAKLTAGEWEIVRDAPYWVFAGLAAADNKQAILTNRKESKALDNALENYKTNNALIRDILANEEKVNKEINKASMFDVEQALGKISQIIESKLGGDDLDAFNEFLLSIGAQVAESAGEGILGVGENVSKREAAAMETMTKALRATDADKRARHQTKEQEERRQAAEEKRIAETKARLDAEAKAQREAAAKAREEAAVKAKEETDAKAKQEAEASAKKLAEDRAAKAAALAQEQAAKLEAQRKAEEARLAAEAAKREAEAQAAETARYIGEHTVVSGDNLSYISKQYYGSTAHWKVIYEENKAVIGDNPNLIRVGQVFKIPRLPEG